MTAKRRNVYVGDKDTTLSSHFQISGSRDDRSRLVRRLHDEHRGSGQRQFGFLTNQLNDNTDFEGDDRRTIRTRLISVLLSYMWIKSDKWGTVNWG